MKTLAPILSTIMKGRPRLSPDEVTQSATLRESADALAPSNEALLTGSAAGLPGSTAAFGSILEGPRESPIEDGGAPGSAAAA
jgi:hypothetical protein